MKPAGTRKIRCAASFVHSKGEISGFFLSSRAMSRASVPAPFFVSSGPAAPGLAEAPGAEAEALMSSGVPVSSSITCRAKSSVIASSRIMRARFSTRALTRRR